MGKLERLPGTIDSMPAVSRILARYDRDKLEVFLAIAIDLLDTMDGDPEAEEEPLEDAFVQHDPACAHMVEDNEAGAYVEWHTKPSNLRRNGQVEITVSHEDDEEDDPAEEDDDSGQCDEEGVNTSLHVLTPRHPGCEISDPDFVDECEKEQMLDDVPMLSVFTLDHSIFNDQRVPLGISNLQDSFIGEGIRSADTGQLHSRSNVKEPNKPGAPV